MSTAQMSGIHAINLNLMLMIQLRLLLLVVRHGIYQISSVHTQNFVNNEWNNDENYRYRWTQDAQKYTDENNTQFKINFELPYAESSKLKFGAAYKDQSKMRDDIWFEYDNDLGRLNTVPTFDATIDSYEPGSKYVLGNFMDARYLGETYPWRCRWS